MKFSFFPTVMLGIILCAAPALAQDDSGYQDNGTQSGGAQSSAERLETRISSLEDQMRAMNGSIEQVQFETHQLEQTLQRMQTDYDARLTRLETAQAQQAQQAQAATAPPQQPATTPAAGTTTAAPPQNPAPDGTLGALKVQNGRVVGGVDNPHAPPLPATPPDYGLTVQEQYDRAFGLLRQTDYADAEKAFKDFIDKNPKDKLTENAKYWYGESLYVQAKFDAAAVAFADAYQQDPRGNKAPDSLLKLAMSLQALKKIPDACVTLQELKVKYPSASAAIKARAADERRQMKCPAR
ncbi:MAG: tol-pal system protein YbgF [Alphaproteobacteria bacterium]|nr:tol-pal system protein YbgF [Alphaproteobacteria bacterium]